MAERRKVGIIYEYNENWIGGTYYIQNLISALNTLPDSEKPEVVIICESNEHFKSLRQITGYAYIEHRFHSRSLNILERVINKASRTLLAKNIFHHYKKGIYKDIDVLFPAWTDGEAFSGCKEMIYWIPDFQERYLPHFFEKDELHNREVEHLKIIDKGKYVLFSSESALKDFLIFYPDNSLKKFVLPFAVTHSRSLDSMVVDIKTKFKLPENYFICSNQFWKHKNHIVILKAIAYLKAQGVEIIVVFTGKESDRRNPDYITELKTLIEQLNIGKNVKFLGFIDRIDQLLLMKNSLAVIQPSLFEGWSTVVEDAKSLGTKLITSSIAVHLEQLKQYGNRDFFDPGNHIELAEIINNNRYQQVPLVNYNYFEDIRQYALNFNEVLREVISARSN